MLSTIIVLSLVLLGMGTYAAPSSKLGAFLRIAEVLIVAVFTAEYLTRVWAAASEQEYRGLSGRLRYVVSPLALLDLLAIAPFYIAAAPLNLWFLRVPRLFRLVRLAKLARYSTSLQRLGRVFRRKRVELTVITAASAAVVMTGAWLIYLAEHESQPDAFANIGSAVWWTVATVTFVGAGDLGPITIAGRVVAAIVAVIGVGLFALPTAVLISAYLEELQTPRTCASCGARVDVA